MKNVERERDILLSCPSHGPVAGCPSAWAATRAKAPRAQRSCTLSTRALTWLRLSFTPLLWWLLQDRKQGPLGGLILRSCCMILVPFGCSVHCKHRAALLGMLCVSCVAVIVVSHLPCCAPNLVWFQSTLLMCQVKLLGFHFSDNQE